MRQPATILLTFCFLILLSSSQAQQRDSETALTLSEKLDQYLTVASQEYKFNGVALVAQKGNLLLHKEYGWKDVKSQTLHDTNSIFQIGSLTKQFTAVAILNLQEQGKLSVLDPLNKYFPDFPKGNKITLQHLLTHTSGLYDYVERMQPFRFLIKKTISKNRIVNIFRDKPLAFEPGTQFQYTSSGYYLLGMVIEKVTGKPYEQVVRETIFNPLGMVNSGFDFRHLKSVNKATGYSVFYEGLQKEAFDMDSTVLYAAGGMYSNTGDLYKWVKAIADKQILAADSWKQALAPYKNNYAYGWTIDSMYGKQYLAHGGVTSNFKSYIIYYPEEDITLILLNNTVGDLWNIGVALSQIIFHQAYAWGNQPEVKLAEAVLNQYAGTYIYTLDNRVQFFISAEAGKLLLNGTPATGVSKTPLVALSETKFYNPKLDLEIEFVKEQDSKSYKLVSKRGGLYSEWRKN